MQILFTFDFGLFTNNIIKIKILFIKLSVVNVVKMKVVSVLLFTILSFCCKRDLRSASCLWCLILGDYYYQDIWFQLVLVFAALQRPL